METGQTFNPQDAVICICTGSVEAIFLVCSGWCWQAGQKLPIVLEALPHESGHAGGKLRSFGFLRWFVPLRHFDAGGLGGSLRLNPADGLPKPGCHGLAHLLLISLFFQPLDGLTG